MKQYVGLDVSQKVTSVCVIDETGRRIWAGKCRSTPDALAATIRERASQAERAGIDRAAVRVALSRPESAWCSGVCIDAAQHLL
jgi:transposase